MQIAQYLPFILMVFILYFLIIRPQNVERKKHEEQLSQLKEGDKVLTRGGIYGKIIGFQGKNNTRLILEIASGTNINIERSYIAGLDIKK